MWRSKVKGYSRYSNQFLTNGRGCLTA